MSFFPPRHKGIPEQFLCESTGQPFKTCLECETDLESNGESYFIEKAIRRYPDSDRTLTIFEFALCANCTSAKQQEISTHSAEVLQNYFEENAQERIIDLDEMDPSRYTETCMFSGKNISESEEYQIVGEFRGKDMVVNHFPFAISGEQIEALSEILSEETKDSFDDFIGTHFSGPPEFAELWEKPKLVLV